MIWNKRQRFYYRTLQRSDQWYWSLGEDLHCEYSAAIACGELVTVYCLHDISYSFAEWCTATGRNQVWHILKEEHRVE